MLPWSAGLIVVIAPVSDVILIDLPLQRNLPAVLTNFIVASKTFFEEVARYAGSEVGGSISLYVSVW